jgi:hypothetical protein
MQGYLKGLGIFCVKCSTMVAYYPLPMYLQCNCKCHGVRHKRKFWPEFWKESCDQEGWANQKNLYEYESHRARGTMLPIRVKEEHRGFNGKVFG